MQHMMGQTRVAVVQNAIEVLLLHLECLPLSERTEQLHMWVESCRREVENWNISPPTDRERDTVTKRVLALHVGIAALEREYGALP
jgi:hypothetical protein